MTSYIGELVSFKRNLSIIKNELDKSRGFCLKIRKSCHFLLFKTFSIVHQLNYIFARGKSSSLKTQQLVGLGCILFIQRALSSNPSVANYCYFYLNPDRISIYNQFQSLPV